MKTLSASGQIRSVSCDSFRRSPGKLSTFVIFILLLQYSLVPFFLNCKVGLGPGFHKDIFIETYNYI